MDLLGVEFKRYFPNSNTEHILMRLAGKPFMCHADNVTEGMQDEFLELTRDSSAKDKFRAQGLEDFWVHVRETYPQLSTNTLNILIQFSTTYLCESGFSTSFTIKPKQQNRLEVECDIRCALSTTAPHIMALCSNKQCQSPRSVLLVLKGIEKCS